MYLFLWYFNASLQSVCVIPKTCAMYENNSCHEHRRVIGKKCVFAIAAFKIYGLLRAGLSSFRLVGQVIPCAEFKNYYN